MIVLTDHTDGVLLPVRAQPGAKRSGVQGEHAGALKVAVMAPAQDGRANSALAELLREALGLRRSQIELTFGASGRDKRFLIRGITGTELESRLEKLLADLGSS